MAEEKINPSWMTADKIKKQVIFNLKAAYNGNNGSWNYNGFYNGSVELVVPEEWNVNIKFHNPDGNYRHSVAIIKSFDINAVPQEAGAELVAVARAYSVGPEHGCLSCKEDIKFLWVSCEFCHFKFRRKKRIIKDSYRRGYFHIFCSKSCYNHGQKDGITGQRSR